MVIFYRKNLKSYWVQKIIYTFNSTPAGTTIGLKEREWGQIGVTIIAGTLGWIIDAPAATAYAVLPVGVETIRPEIIIYLHYNLYILFQFNLNSHFYCHMNSGNHKKKIITS